MPTEPDLMEQTAALEGQVVGQGIALAMLVHAARAGVPIEVVKTEIDGVRQLLEEQIQTSFPKQRIFFIIGLRSGYDQIFGMADAVGEIMAEKRHGP